MTSDMLCYMRILEKLAKKHQKDRIPCDNDMRTCVWTQLALTYAESEVCFYVDSLLGVPFRNEPVKHALKTFLNRPWTSVRVLSRSGVTPQEVKNFRTSSDITLASIDIRSAVGSYSRDDSRLFATIDNTGFRFEGQVSLACFNEPLTAIKLNNAFEQAWALTHRIV